MNTRQVYLPSRKRIRLRGYDFAQPGWYFVTIVLNERTPVLGVVDGSAVILSEAGQTVHEKWLEIPLHHERVAIDAFVVMPDHIHGLLAIREDNRFVETVCGCCHKMWHINPTECTNRLEEDLSPTAGEAFGRPCRDTIPTIMRSYKSSATRACTLSGHPIRWQTRFYDRVVRNHRELEAIRRYIICNPKESGQFRH